MSVALPVEFGDRQQVARVKLRTVDADRVDFARVICGPHMSVGRAAAGADPNDDDIALPRRPLALHPQQLRVQIEDQVVALSLAQRARDADVQLDGRGGELRLGDVAFLRRREHGTNASSQDVARQRLNVGAVRRDCARGAGGGPPGGLRLARGLGRRRIHGWMAMKIEVERRGRGGWDNVLDSEEGLVAPGGEWRSQLWQTAVRQFDQAADRLALEPEIRVRLLEPRRALTVNFPVRRDDG